MSKNRLEAFSDGVIAIIITIMVLELKVPHSAEMSVLVAMGPHFASYVLSFVFIGIYWNNHHHLLQAAECVSGPILWANLHLLFWLSLIPVTTGWMGENGFAALPVAFYGIILLCSGIAYYILSKSLIKQHGKNSALAKAIGADKKGLISVVLYAIGIPVAFYVPLLANLIYISVALMWLKPDKRIEAALHIEKCD